MYRSHTCGELRLQDKGKKVQLAGWVQTVRKYGAITFVDLRDRYGVTQLLFGETINSQLDSNPLGREFVLQVNGTVIEITYAKPTRNYLLYSGAIQTYGEPSYCILDHKRYELVYGMESAGNCNDCSHTARSPFYFMENPSYSFRISP